MSSNKVHIIGGGLAGSEAAWQLAQTGVPVTLYEMRPHRKTDAHVTDGLAELVIRKVQGCQFHQCRAITITTIATITQTSRAY